MVPCGGTEACSGSRRISVLAEEPMHPRRTALHAPAENAIPAMSCMAAMMASGFRFTFPRSLFRKFVRRSLTDVGFKN